MRVEKVRHTTHKRAREALKYMLSDRTYRLYEYRVATRKFTEWEA